MLDIFGGCCVILTAIAAIAIMKILTISEKCPILNVYRTQSNLYNIKVAFVYIFLPITKLLESVVAPCEITENLDKPQKLPVEKYAIDGVYFNGSNEEGDRLSISINRRNNKETECYSFLTLGSLKTLINHESNPFTFSYETKENKKFSSTG
ncbi:hypothetical protein FQR65_LT07477 [Abscondita terminalis]|nr:hypothetical protein FQR65_LT07477 [Abscondita terminalis]